MRVPVYDDRVCADCGATFTPTGPAAKYCHEHQDERLRAGGRWKRMRERSHRRGVVGDRCECCGAPAKGASYFGVVCCEQCREDAEKAAHELLDERRRGEMLTARRVG